MRKIKICHLVHGFNVGGLERIIVNTINELGTDVEHTIIALTVVGTFVEQINVPVSFYSLNKSPGNDWSIYRKLHRLLKELEPDVLHSYNLSTIEYQWVGKWLGIPIRIHAEHGRDSYDPFGHVKKYQRIRRVCALAVTQVVAVSQDLHSWLATSVKIPSKKLSLIHNGVDTDFFVKKTTSNEYFRIGHVARLQHIKNQTMLLAAFKLACQKNRGFENDARLTIVGDGPEYDKLSSSVTGNDTETVQIEFVGEQQDVLPYYQTFDLFVLSSLAEGVPMTLLESMSVGMPHVVTHVGGISEVIIEEETGLSTVVDDIETYSEHLIDLYENPERRHLMGIACRKRVVNKFSQKRMIEQYKLLYQLE